jgi:hypothetical protein
MQHCMRSHSIEIYKSYLLPQVVDPICRDVGESRASPQGSEACV